MRRQDLEGLYADLAGRVASSALRVAIGATYPIEEFKAALAHAEREGCRGKILVTPDGPCERGAAPRCASSDRCAGLLRIRAQAGARSR